MGNYIDLHVHSTASDGTLSPSEVVSLALKKDLKALALTDHDTTEGLDEAIDAARGTGLLVIPGIEFSTAWLEKDVHIVGLNIDHKNAYFQENLKIFQRSRDLRNEKIISLLQKEGISISAELMQKTFPESIWTRAHFARFLLDNHYVSSMNEAFDRYLGDHAKCYVPREKVTPFQAINLIHEADGITVFAHPALCRFSSERLESLTAELKRCGLDAMESLYSTYKPREQAFITQLAKRHHLKCSGGSDFHGSNKPRIDLGTGMGNLKIPYSIWENLKER